MTDSKTLESLPQWKSEFIEQVGNDDDDEFAFIVVGNKVDLEVTRQVTRAKGEQVARDIGAVAHFETSAKTAHNVEKAFHMAANAALKRNTQRKPVFSYVSTVSKVFWHSFLPICLSFSNLHLAYANSFTCHDVLTSTPDPLLRPTSNQTSTETHF